MRLRAGSSRRRGSQPAAVFLAVGSDVLLRTSELVAILGRRALEAAPTREFLGFARRRGVLEDLSAGEPVKAAVVCRRRVFLTPLSSGTLRRRTAGRVRL